MIGANYNKINKETITKIENKINKKYIGHIESV